MKFKYMYVSQEKKMAYNYLNGCYVPSSPKHRHIYTNKYTHRDTYIHPHSFFFFFLEKMTAKFYFLMFSVSNKGTFFLSPSPDPVQAVVHRNVVVMTTVPQT